MVGLTKNGCFLVRVRLNAESSRSCSSNLGPRILHHCSPLPSPEDEAIKTYLILHEQTVTSEALYSGLHVDDVVDDCKKKLSALTRLRARNSFTHMFVYCHFPTVQYTCPLGLYSIITPFALTKAMLYMNKTPYIPPYFFLLHSAPVVLVGPYIFYHIVPYSGKSGVWVLGISTVHRV